MSVRENLRREREREREREKERVCVNYKPRPLQSDNPPPKGLIYSPSAPVHTSNSPLTRKWHQLISWVCILLSHNKSHESHVIVR